MDRAQNLIALTIGQAAIQIATLQARVEQLEAENAKLKAKAEKQEPDHES